MRYRYAKLLAIKSASYSIEENVDRLVGQQTICDVSKRDEHQMSEENIAIGEPLVLTKGIKTHTHTVCM